MEGYKRCKRYLSHVPSRFSTPRPTNVAIYSQFPETVAVLHKFQPIQQLTGLDSCGNGRIDSTPNVDRSTVLVGPSQVLRNGRDTGKGGGSGTTKKRNGKVLEHPFDLRSGRLCDGRSRLLDRLDKVLGLEVTVVLFAHLFVGQDPVGIGNLHKGPHVGLNLELCEVLSNHGVWVRLFGQLHVLPLESDAVHRRGDSQDVIERLGSFGFLAASVVVVVVFVHLLVAVIIVVIVPILTTLIVAIGSSLVVDPGGRRRGRRSEKARTKGPTGSCRR